MPRLYVIPPGLLSGPAYPALKRWAKLFRASGAGFTPEVNLLDAFNVLHGELLTLVRGFDFPAVFENRSRYSDTLFPGHIAEICAIRGRLRELVCRRVANGLLDLIGRFFSISFVEHIGQTF
jgi:hypothetical protein